MKRTSFIRNLFGIGMFTAMGCRIDNNKKTTSAVDIQHDLEQTPRSMNWVRKELLDAWNRSEEMTMANVGQMPPEYFFFKYTPEAMSFSEQWRHCVIYTCGQLAGRAGIKNPYEDVKLPVQMPKEDVIRELKNMYHHVRASLIELTEEKLFATCDFAGKTIPIWRLFYAMENHIIHHRGQCIVYLRLKGITPKGYYGW